MLEFLIDACFVRVPLRGLFRVGNDLQRINFVLYSLDVENSLNDRMRLACQRSTTPREGTVYVIKSF